MVIIWILLLIYSLSTIWSIYFDAIGWLLSTSYYIKSFFYNIFSYIIFIWIVWLIWKVLWGKAKFLDVLFITMLAQIIFIIVNIIFTITLLSQSVWLVWIITFISIPALIWFLIIWSKWLSKIEVFSETKVTLTVVISLVLIYFGNSFLSWITWMSAL